MPDRPRGVDAQWIPESIWKPVNTVGGVQAPESSVMQHLRGRAPSKDQQTCIETSPERERPKAALAIFRQLLLHHVQYDRTGDHRERRSDPRHPDLEPLGEADGEGEAAA